MEPTFALCVCRNQLANVDSATLVTRAQIGVAIVVGGQSQHKNRDDPEWKAAPRTP